MLNDGKVSRRRRAPGCRSSGSCRPRKSRSGTHMWDDTSPLGLISIRTGEQKDCGYHPDASPSRPKRPHVAKESGACSEVGADLFACLPCCGIPEAWVLRLDPATREGHVSRPRIALPLCAPDQQHFLPRRTPPDDHRDGRGLPARPSRWARLGLSPSSDSGQSRPPMNRSTVRQPENLKIRFSV